MESEKTLLELYEIVKDKIRFRGNSPFICFCANKCLTYEENKRFIEHFYSQRPSETQYTEFFNEPLFRKTKSLQASWFEYDYSLSVGEWYQTRAFKLRIKLLEAIIKNLKKKKKK